MTLPRALTLSSLLLLAGPALASEQAAAAPSQDGVASAETDDYADAPRLNVATADDFAAIEGVDEDLAVRIVELRSERGRLGSVESLRILDVPPDTLDRLREEVIVDMPIIKAANRKSYQSVDQVMGEFADEPSVQRIQGMAMEYSKTNPELVEGWLASSRSAFLLPKLNLKYQKDLNLNEDYIYISDDQGDNVLSLDGQDADNDDTYEVKLEWRLDRLIMSSERIRVINEAQDIVKLRDKVLDEVTRLYFDRRRLQVELLLSPPSDLRTQIKKELQLQELTANLDALTGGGFSATLPTGG